MQEYTYLILDYDGKCWRVGDGESSEVSLPDLLTAGWTPLRETPFSANIHSPYVSSYILILLARDLPDD